MVHELLKPIDKYIHTTVPFRAAQYANVLEMLERANVALNRGIENETIKPLDVPGIERQMILLRIAAKNRAKYLITDNLGANSPQKVGLKQPAKLLQFPQRAKKHFLPDAS